MTGEGVRDDRSWDAWDDGGDCWGVLGVVAFEALDSCFRRNDGEGAFGMTGG